MHAGAQVAGRGVMILLERWKAGFGLRLCIVEGGWLPTLDDGYSLARLNPLRLGGARTLHHCYLSLCPSHLELQDILHWNSITTAFNLRLI